MPDYAHLWDQYELVVGALYEGLGPAGAVSIPPVRSADIGARADLVIAASSRLGDTAAQGISAPAATEREQSTLWLIAGAAADLAVANDLMRSQVGGPATALYPELMSDLGPILRPGPGATPRIATRGTTFKPPTSDPDEARAHLRWTANRSFDAIADDVIDIGQMALSGLIALEAAPVQQAAAVAVQEILNKIGDGLGAILRQAARLLVMAYDKLLKALGQDAASEARQQAARWIRMLQSGTLFDSLLERLYEKQRILDDIDGQARQALDVLLSEAFSRLLGETEGLAERFRDQRRSIEWLLRGLAFTKDWLFAVKPWGPLAVTALYVGTLGYAVYAGGDYVDWFRTEQIVPLNRVPGLRDVVRDILIVAP